MKTRDKILLASLTLFNDEGEGNVTTVDIANELDISPGNLYYHFHGKEQIILELYAGFELEMVDILEAPLEQSLDAQDAWFYLYIVFEQIFKHRYLYHNLNDILQRYPDIDRRFGRLLDLKRRAASAVAGSHAPAQPRRARATCPAAGLPCDHHAPFRRSPLRHRRGKCHRGRPALLEGRRPS